MLTNLLLFLLILCGAASLGYVFRNKMRIKTKIALLGLLIGVGAAGGIGLIATGQSRIALRDTASDSLLALATSRQHHIEHYFNTIREQIRNFANEDTVINATAQFAAAFHDAPSQLKKTPESTAIDAKAVKAFFDAEYQSRLKANAQPYRGAQTYLPQANDGQALQAMYIANNPNPPGEKLKFNAAPDPCDYNTLHAYYHPKFRQFLESFEYYDIFLFDLEGNIVYTVFKEADYATNFRTGPYKDTGLGQVFRQAASAKKPGEVFLVDFAPYEPSYGAAASFIATPVFDAEGKKIGVAAYQMPVGKINGILNERDGLGETGETYMVGQDLLMRSDSRFSDTSTIFVQKVDTPTVKAALAGDSGVQVVDDYRGVPVVSAYAPLKIEGLQWVILAEKDLAEVNIPATTLQYHIWTVTAGLVVTVVVISLFFSAALTKPLVTVIKKVAEMAQGGANLRQRLDESRADEMGDLARQFNAYTVTLNSIMLEIANQSQSVAAAATEIAATAEEMSQGMTTQTSQITEITTSVEQMASSIVEVAKRSGDAANNAHEAGKVAKEGQEVVAQTVNDMNAISQTVTDGANRVKELGKRGEQIGEVIKVINDIADQTNLLALNAAIEAARAGEHGRGFAVVADEVRKLADRTTKATDEIGQSIKMIQDETQLAVDQMSKGTKGVSEGVTRATAAGQSLGRIVSSSADVAKMIEVIASAAEEQSSAGEQVSRSIERVRTVTNQANEAANQTSSAANTLSQNAESLEALVSKFDLERRSRDAGPPKGMPDRRGNRQAKKAA